MNAAHRWLHEPGHELSLDRGGALLCRHHFATDHRKPFLHPVHTASGIPLTCFEPWDHVWHRGLWFSWKFLNGVNYWEETEDGKQDGQTELVGPETVNRQPDRATIAIRLQYRPPTGEIVLEETREITIQVPRADGTYAMDWRLTFTATREDVTLDRTPITPQTPWGGYGGLSWRAARSLGNFRLLDSEGRRDKDVQHQRARWLDLSGQADGGRNLAAGIAMIDHPSNPRHPSAWKTFADPGFGYINPAFLLNEPFPLRTRQALTLRYRVLIHDGWPDDDAIEKAYDAFAREQR